MYAVAHRGLCEVARTIGRCPADAAQGVAIGSAAATIVPMQILDMLAEQRILEAIERGEFDNLPGSGRPLDLDEDMIVPEELRVAYRILKNAGFLPREVEMRREISDVGALIRATAGETRGAAERRLQYLLMCLEMQRGGEGLAAAAEAYLAQVRDCMDRTGDGSGRH